MALDHALADCLRDGEAALRLYGWNAPTVSFGKNEVARPVERADGQVAYVRRPTGGRAVLHADELTYAVVAPLEAFGGMRDAYWTINESLLDALLALGAEVRIVRTGDAPPARVAGVDAGPCFRKPARGEIVSGGRKLVGSAQARLGGVLLQHGSLLMGGDQRLLGGAHDGVEPVTLSELLGGVAADSVAVAVAVAMRRRFGGEWREDGYDARELEAANRHEAERYGQDEWTWRR